MDKELLLSVDRILCESYYGDNLKECGTGWLEIGLEKGDAEILQEFHDKINDKTTAQH